MTFDTSKHACSTSSRVRQSQEMQGAHWKGRMEEEDREVARKRLGDGEGLKSDIKEPICQKCKFLPSTETKQGAFQIEKQVHG